jgi:hypothetical protein
MKLSPKQGQFAFAVVMVGTMTFLMTGVMSFVNADFTLRVATWLRSWLLAYATALPIMLVLSPPIRRVIWTRVEEDAGTGAAAPH